MRTRATAGCVFCLLLSASLSAQIKTGPFPPGQGRGDGAGRATPIDPAQLGIVAIEPFDIAQPVIAVPYSAEAVTETLQVLGDGNRIRQRTSVAIARDGKGRVRREERGLGLGGLMTERSVPLVTITDPAAGIHLLLDPERRVAVRSRIPVREAQSRGNVAGSGTRIGSPATRVPSERILTERLGERAIAGLRAEGARTTLTIAADAVGNQSPLTIVSERWYSPELQVVVLTHRSDPRFGETTYRLVNIVRSEPATSLFDVPAGYRIEEQTPPLPSLR